MPMTETRMHQHTSRWTTGGGTALAAVALCLVVALAACGSSTEPSGPKNPIGSYVIATVNGKAPPVAIFADTGFTYEVMSGSAALTSDGKYSIVTTYRQTLPGNVSIFVDSFYGTWMQNGSVIRFTDGQDGSTNQATWANAQLMFVESDGNATDTYVYALKR